MHRLLSILVFTILAVACFIALKPKPSVIPPWYAGAEMHNGRSEIAAAVLNVPMPCFRSPVVQMTFGGQWGQKVRETLLY